MATRPTRKRAAPKAQKTLVTALAPAPRASKRARVAAEPAKPATSRRRPPKGESIESLPTTLAVINHAPEQVLDVLMCGNGENGELGLGPSRTEAPTPRGNPFLHAGTDTGFHVVQLDCGGMHTVALTKRNEIVTWGVNDNGALGRSTEWSGGLRDVDKDRDDDQSSSSSSSSDDGGLNPLESTPAAIPASAFPPNTTFVQVAAGDSCSLALTDKGFVYGWGTFKTRNGDEMFSYDTTKGRLVERQTTPALIQGLAGITQIACGANHALALDAARGVVWTWGNAEQNQLGRRIVDSRQQHERQQNKASLSLDTDVVGLIPQPVHIRDVRYIATGEYHSFAVDRRNNVWAWGFNGFGETGADPQSAGRQGADVLLPYPKRVRQLAGEKVAVLAGGGHHSVAVMTDGRCLAWGRLDIGQLGIKFREDQLSNQNYIRRDERGNPRICAYPTVVTAPVGLVRHVACGTDHTIFVSRDGSVYTTGFNAQGQLGLGHDDDVYVAQRVGSKAVDKRKITWAGAGGQFSVLAGPHVASPVA
ncbi:MAG: hypothetical protein STHCBS139747_001781 [Sporothrix thermara]